MLSERSHYPKLVSTKEPLSPSSSSSSLFLPDATTSKSVTINLASPGSPSSRLEQNDPKGRDFANPDPHSSVFVAGPTTPKLPTRQAYLPTPPETPETPERLSTRPKIEVQTLAPGLPTLPELSRNPSPRPLPKEQISQDIESSAGLSVSEAGTSEPITFNPVSPEASFTDLIQSNPEELDFLSSDPHITWRFFRSLLNILASLRPRRARAREGRVRNVIRSIEQVRDGKYPGTQLLIRRKLYHSEYRDVLARVETDNALNGFFYDGLRFDYSHADKQFTIYMACAVHDTFVVKVGKEIERFLDEHKSSSCDNVIMKIARGMDGTGAQNFSPPELEYTGKAPDLSYQHDDCSYPGLVVEVLWSRDKPNVEKKVKYYFESTHGEVRTVVGFNLNDVYNTQQAAEQRWNNDKKKRKKGKLPSSPEPLTFLAPAAAAQCVDFSVWRAKQDLHTGKTIIAGDSVLKQIFRNADQQHNPDVSLKLSLEDFVCKAAVDKLCIEEGSKLQKIEYPQLEISSELLCDWFETAVRKYRPQWERVQKRKANQQEKNDNAKTAARRKEAATLEEEAHKPNILGRLGRFRDLTGRLRSERHRKPEEERPSGS